MPHQAAAAPARKPLMPLDEAVALIRASATPLPERLVPLDEALHHVLSRDVISLVDVPGFDNSAMDGYALDAAVLAAPGASGGWPVSQRVPAGTQPEPLQAGTVARIFTGAPVPGGATAVVPQEQADLSVPGRVRFLAEVKPGQHVRRQGEDMVRGQSVLPAGTRLGAAHLGLAASAGADKVWVRARPKVALVSTGDELALPGQPLPPGGIYNANRFTLAALLRAWGLEVVDLGRVPDQLSASCEALRAAAAQADVVLSSGGVSVGEEDHWRAALNQLGTVQAWALAIKPGKPLLHGVVTAEGGRPVHVMGLPGNPVAAWVTALVALDPLLAALEGGAPRCKGWTAVAGFDWPRPDARREFLRASLGEDGRVTLHPKQGSAMLSSCTQSDGLVDNPPGQVIRRGDPVRFLPWGQWGLVG